MCNKFICIIFISISRYQNINHKFLKCDKIALIQLASNSIQYNSYKSCFIIVCKTIVNFVMILTLYSSAPSLAAAD